MEDHKIASLKLTNDLKYYDLKLENDYTPYLSNIILKIFIFYVVSHIIFLGYILIYQGVFTVLDDSKVSTILYAVWISISLLFTLPKIKENLKKYFVFYYFLGLLMQIISIYVEEEYNDLKIGVLFLFNISFALMFNLREFKSTITGTIFYLLALLPALFLKSKYLVNKNLFEYSEIISATTDDEEYSTPLEYSNFLKEHIGLYVIIAVIILSSALILFLYSYDQELYSRINFLKIDHKKLQFKKDQEIFDNLVPKFIQNKMESGSNRGASIDEEIVTVIFVDICDFDGLVTKMSPKEFINLLDKIYSTFDQLCSIHGLQKIETVSKTYMASGGIRECEKDLDPVVLSKHHSVRTFELALDMIDLMSKMRLDNGDTLKIKVGIHSREVNAAVVGNHKPQFSLIGDTVNTTARMCAYSKEMSILVTEEAYAEISKFYQDFVLIERQVKGKGLMKTYLCTPIKSKQEQEQDKQAKSLFTNFLKSALNKRGREGGILADLDLGSEKIERKNSFKSNNSSFIIDSFGTDKDKIKPLIDFTIIDPTIKHKNLENWLYKFSCFFLNFYDSNLIPITSQKKEKPSVLFENYSAHKYNNTFMTGIYINYIFCFGASMISYFYTYYNLTLNYNNEVIGIKLLLTITLIYITNRVKHSHNIRNQNLTYLVCFLYFCFIILLQVQFNIYSKEFFIFLTIEQNFTIVAAFFNCIINYMQTFFLMILFIVSFCVCIAVGHDEQLIVRYSICSILISLLFFGYYLFREYIGTIEYVENKMQSEELKNRERLLFNLMPPHVVQYLKEDIPVVDELFDVTMLYTDIVKFTDFSMAQSSPKNVVRMLIELFRRFDDAVLRNDVYKVHTIGDCYVVLGFTGKVPSNERDPAEEAMKVINLGKEMISIIKEVAASKEVNFPALNMRIGIHTVSLFQLLILNLIIRELLLLEL